MIHRLTYAAIISAIAVTSASAAQGVNGWVFDSNLATYEGPVSGTAHLPAVVRVSVDESQIAVVGWDIFTPERDEGLLSMLLSTTWESSMKPWQPDEDWFVSSDPMPMSDGSHWFLWYRSTGGGITDFQLGAPPFVDQEQIPHYTITDGRQRRWSFAQPYLSVPEPSSVCLSIIGLMVCCFCRDCMSVRR